jgi:two-component system response regulator RegA
MKLDRPAPALLIVDDDDNFRTTLMTEFAERGYGVQGADSVEEFRRLRPVDCTLAIIDLKLDRDSGLTVLQELLVDSPSCKAVIISGYGSIATAVTAVKLGAHDYLIKPTGVTAIENALLGSGHHPIAATSQTEMAEVPSLARHEREYIDYILAQCGGNISEAARRLGLHRQSLQRKLRKYPPLR